MYMYQDCECPYCGKAFSDSDDLAVCPECGTPHHRACYKEHGQCANAKLHDEGFVWAAPKTQNEEASSSSVICAGCGAANQDGVNFCNQCGAPIAKAPPLPAYVENGASGNRQMSADVIPPELEQAIKDNKKLDGIDIKSWMTFIATSIGYYLYCFKIQDDSGKKFTFTWSAMMFPVVYFLYRRVWTAAIAAFAANFIISIPMVMITLFVPLGVNLGLSVEFWTSAANVCSMVIVMANFCWGLFAVYLYRKSAIRKMTALRKKCSTEQEFSSRLAGISGPSTVAILLVFAPYILMMAVAFLIVTLL
ncbi:MAG: RING finger protein [Oscillospiraceae bacterium]